VLGDSRADGGRPPRTVFLEAPPLPDDEGNLDMSLPDRRRMRLAGGTELSYVTAGDASNPAVLLLHGFPSSADTFRDVIPGLARVAHVIAPDLPGHGRSDVLPTASFAAFSDAISEVLDDLAVGPRYVYLHDWGAPVGLEIAMRAPELVAGLIIQNANAHRTGFGPEWKPTFAYWDDPSPSNEAAATTHMTFEGTRAQYVGGLPAEVTARIEGEPWVEDWNVMCLPGRMETQRALLADYEHHVARFGEIAEYLSTWQPPALMLWGRHDPFFDIAETLSWMQDLPRMEAHVFDAGHMLLETHAEPALALMVEFIERTRSQSST
jgi:pimeloyl-ACP methyl ester carboxylesterase